MEKSHISTTGPMDPETSIRRHAIEQALSDYARFPEMNPGPVCRIALDGTVLLANPVAKQLFGGTELIGNNWMQICPGLTLSLWQEVLAALHPFPIEATLGEKHIQFTYVLPEERDLVFVYGADITANKLIERKLAEQAALISEMARFPEMNPGPVLRMDLEGTILLSNAAATNVFGQNLLTKNWRKVNESISAEHWDDILASSDVVPVESIVGSRHFVFNHRRDFKSRQVYAYGTDITANKFAERKLAEQAATIAEIARFPHMNPGPVLRMDVDGKILLSNVAASGVFGDELEDKNWRAICPGLDEAAWQRILTSNKVEPVEARVGDKEFVFNHRRDFHSNLVFAFGTDVTLQKAAERTLRQSEKMATLGTLAAGVAHELNNPAAATRRAALQLRESIAALEKSHARLNSVVLTPDEQKVVMELAAQVQQSASRSSDLDSLTRSDRESAIEDWLDERDVDDPWYVAPALVAAGYEIDSLRSLEAQLSDDALAAIIPWLAHLHPVYSLLYEIGEGSSRISEIVVAMKNYSYLGQAPIQEVNVHEGIDNTLVILRNKLKVGITVHKEYTPDLPGIVAYGSELNQVWTNLLDNAADAMNGRGDITIRTRRDAAWIAVEIEDNGPGIPEQNQSRVFDPFFTTKPPGKGTGLGLATTYGIVTEKHRGELTLVSRPGQTRFTVRLPIAYLASTASS